MNYKRLDVKDIEKFIEIFGRENVYWQDAINEIYSHDEMTFYGRYFPECVITARNAEQIAQLMRYCNEMLIPVTPRGAGTGLCGGSVCICGGVLLSVEKMNRVLEIDGETLTAVVEPGVRLMELQALTAERSLLYAPDPGEKSASLGGNVMTNAGGMRAVSYGVTRDYVKGMDVVLADGSIISLGGKLEKSSSGYSLKDLLIGSEGTLGIVTKIYLKLLAKPQKMISLLIPFRDLKSCLETVPKILALPDRPTTLEFCEREVIEDAIVFLGKQFPSKEYPAYLIVSYCGASKAEIESIYDDTCRLALENGAVDCLISDTEERQESIWNARGAFLEAINNSTASMDECDVVVPINRIYEYLQFVKELSAKHGLRIRSFGHAGDGNIHVYVCKDDIPDDSWPSLAKQVMLELYGKASELKGLTSGEHGIGHAKKEFLDQSLGEVQIGLMKLIKKSFDPNNILNPGKVVDIDE